MSIFKKSEGVDVLDFTRLQKKGLLKVPEQKAESNIKVNSQGYVDLGLSNLSNSNSASESAPSYPSPSSESNGASALGFLDSLASSSPSSSGSSEQQSYFGSSPENNSLDLQGLKNKIEDLEYKMRMLEDKISKMGG
jgi:hypothetical protein